MAGHLFLTGGAYSRVSVVRTYQALVLPAVEYAIGPKLSRSTRLPFTFSPPGTKLFTQAPLCAPAHEARYGNDEGLSIRTSPPSGIERSSD